MKKLLACLLVLASTKAFAEISYSMPALELGFKWNSMDADGASSNKQTLGWQMGGSVVLNLNEEFGLRTGLFYAERPFKNEFAGSEVTGKITYIDVPAHFMFKLEDYAGVYLGPSLSMKLGDEVSVGSLSGVQSMIVPITFGGSFKIQENFGMNIFFETIPSKIATGITASRGIGVNVFFAL